MYKVLAIFLILLLGAGCVPAGMPTGQASPIARYPGVQTVESTFSFPTKNAIKTLGPPAPSGSLPPSSLTPTPTSTPDLIHKDCLMQMEGQRKPTQGIALIWKGQGSDTETFLYDLSDQGYLKTVGQNLYYPVISLDHQRLAYKKHDPDQLVIWNSRDGITKLYPWQKEWFTIVEWLNERQLVIETSFGELHTDFTDTMIFDVETGKTTILQFDLPDLYWNVPYLYWGSYSFQRVVYSPGLTRAFYANDAHGTRIALYDLVENKQITSFPAGQYGLSPQKSPDGKRILFQSKLKEEEQWELYELGWDGELRQLTSFTGQPRDIHILVYTPSPDGKSVALVLGDYTNGVPGDLSLNLLSLDNMSITDLCLPEMNTDRSIDSPVWLGNGEQMLFTMYDNDNVPSTILIDLREKTYRIIYPGAGVSGWLAEP